MINNVKKAYPDTQVFATTLREVVSANQHLWGAIMAAGDNWHVIEPREIGVLDRIGGGDGFVGGMLYAILKGWDSEKWAQFGWGHRRTGYDNADRLRPARRRRPSLEHLAGQRTGQAIS